MLSWDEQAGERVCECERRPVTSGHLVCSDLLGWAGGTNIETQEAGPGQAPALVVNKNRWKNAINFNTSI